MGLPNLLVLANKRFATDFRKYLMRSVERHGSHATHIYCWEKIIVAQNGSEVRHHSPDVDETRVIKELGDRLAPPLIALTGLGCNEASFATRLQRALPHGLFVYDVYDDLMFGASGRDLLARKVQDLVWRARCEYTILLDAALAQRYPCAHHLDNASHLRPLPGVEDADRTAMVYIGSIDCRVDFGWLHVAAEQDGTIDIYGVVHLGEPATAAELEAFLATHPNVRYCGGYDNDDLWGILGKYRIGLVPYHPDHPMTQHLNPDKIFHYLNAGLEVLAAPFPQALRHAGHIHLIEKGGDWRQAMIDIGTRPRRGDWSAEANSWDRRYLDLIRMLLADMDKPTYRRSRQG
jgi:hypothetical protein